VSVVEGERAKSTCMMFALLNTESRHSWDTPRLVYTESRHSWATPR
jgi:hypothetical protein